MIDTVVVVHGRAEAEAALARAAGPLTLVSAADAAGFAGAGWWAALAAWGRATFPAVEQRWVLDCGDAPGHALAALRAGVTELVFRGDPALRAKLAAIAEQQNATILDAPPARRGA